MNRPVSPAQHEREAHYAEAGTWAEDLAAAERRSRKVAWIVAGVAATVALAEALALLLMLPLKTTVPYIVTVNPQTGFAAAQKLAPGGALTQNDALTQSMLMRYVTARETYDQTDLKENYRNVQWWSAPDARAAYLAAMNPQNPTSPLKVNGPQTTVKVRVKSVSVLGPGTALVRFDAERLEPGAATGMVQPYAAAIGFQWSGQPVGADERFVNPLGFQVTRYRRDAETAAPVPAPGAPQ